MAGISFQNANMTSAGAGAAAGAGGSGGFYQTSYGPPQGNSTVGMNGGMSGTNEQYYVPSQQSTTTFEDEPPLHEELGINVQSVISKARAVANPFSHIDSSFADEADMTGPVLICLLLGLLLLLQRKMQFGVIYGQAIVGCLSVYFVFNLMSQRGIDLYRSTSILGYSLLPMVILSVFAIFIPLKVKALSIVLGGGCIFWSTTTATKIFVAVLSLHDQFWLVWYPLALLYTSFAFITVF